MIHTGRGGSFNSAGAKFAGVSEFFVFLGHEKLKASLQGLFPHMFVALAFMQSWLGRREPYQDLIQT